MRSLLLWAPVLALGALVLWSLVDGLVFEPRRAQRRFEGVAAALGLQPVDDAGGGRRVGLDVSGRTVTLHARHVGSHGTGIRGETGRLWIVETPLRVSRWEMHDVQIRPRRRAGDFDRRFTVRESGVPVRDGWLTPPVRASVAAFFDQPLATGTLRVDRGLLQYVVSWNRLPERPAPGDVHAIVERLAVVADAFDETASRRHPMG
jgi:hypothetical protein